MMHVSYDFDGTLLRDSDPANLVNDLISRYMEGTTISIVTTRNPLHEHPDWYIDNEPERVCVMDFIKDHLLPVQQVVFTNHTTKAPWLKQMGVDLHYDNDPDEVEEAKALGIDAVLVQ